jgi:hypothetical protein
LPFHGERYLTHAQRTMPELTAAIQEKQRLVRQSLPKGSRRERHLGIVEANAQILSHLHDTRRQLIDQYQQAQADTSRRALFGSREFSFCLFPASLVDRLQTLADPVNTPA